MKKTIQRTVMTLAMASLLSGCIGLPLGKKKTVQSSEKNPQVLINTKLGLAYLQQGNLDKAQEKLKKAIGLNASYTEAHHYLAETYRQQGKASKANEEYLQAIKLSANDPALHNNYGVFLCGTGHYTEAETQFLIAANNPTYASIGQAYENSGLCMLKMEDVPRATFYFQQALQHNPSLSKAVYQSAKIAFAKGRAAAAQDYLARYERLAEHTAKTLWLAIQLNKTLEKQQAVAIYSRLLIEGFRGSEEYKKLTGLDAIQGEEIAIDLSGDNTFSETDSFDGDSEEESGLDGELEDEGFANDESTDNEFDTVTDEVADEVAGAGNSEDGTDELSDEAADYGNSEDDAQASQDDVESDSPSPNTKALRGIPVADSEMKVVQPQTENAEYQDPLSEEDLDGDGIPDVDQN